jgi:hypothetical protein
MLLVKQMTVATPAGFEPATFSLEGTASALKLAKTGVAEVTETP